MGKLDFSSIDGRQKKEKEITISFCGRFNRCDERIRFLQKNNIPYLLVEGGAIRRLIDGNKNEMIYMAKPEYGSQPTEIMRCCKAVGREVDAFTEVNGALSFIPSTTQVYDKINIYEHLVGAGSKVVSLVDADHCYWQIAYNNKIIGEELYNDYLGKDKKECRIIAMGNLAKPTVITKEVNGVKQERTIQNKRSWAWNFVVYKTFFAMIAVRQATYNKMFSYNTDGIYLPDYCTEKAVETFNKLGFSCKVDRFNIVGYWKHYCILENIITGKRKRANLGGRKETLQTFLPYVELNVPLEE